jgi:RNA polymerase sigma-70 factor (ECF subfamily)
VTDDTAAAGEGVDGILTRAHQDEWARIVASLIRETRDWTIAEDATQEAFARAAARWPIDGVPRSPGAWLMTVARRAALDALRRRAAEDRRVQAAGIVEELTCPADAADAQLDWADDRVRLIFTCAHPALSMEARVALTLRVVGGLETDEIAHAFLVSPTTMAQRLVRAKRRISGAGIPYRVPSATELPDRLGGVLAVLYLVFSEGYAAASGEQPLRDDLAQEAIRLLRLVVDLLPEPERDDPRALLALMLLQHSRRSARVRDGEVVPFDEQDRARWDHQEIAEAVALLGQAPARRTPYRLQAELAAAHATAAAPSEVPWSTVAALYDELAAFGDSPVVLLNRAVAIGFAETPQRGLDELHRLSGRAPLAGGHLLPAARAHFLRQSGRPVEAAAAYRAAAERAPTAAERRFLERRAAETSAESEQGRRLV